MIIQKNQGKILDDMKDQYDSEKIPPKKYDRKEDDDRHIIKRNKQYTELLVEYKRYWKSSLNFKSSSKKKIVIFFAIILLVVIIFFIAVCIKMLETVFLKIMSDFN